MVHCNGATKTAIPSKVLFLGNQAERAASARDATLGND